MGGVAQAVEVSVDVSNMEPSPGERAKDDEQMGVDMTSCKARL